MANIDKDICGPKGRGEEPIKKWAEGLLIVTGGVEGTNRRAELGGEPFGVGDTSKHWEGIEDKLSINRDESPNGLVKALAHTFIAAGHVREASGRNSDRKKSPRVVDKARVAVKNLLLKDSLPSVTAGGANTSAPVNKGAVVGGFAFKCNLATGGSRRRRRRRRGRQGRSRGRRRGRLIKFPETV